MQDSFLELLNLKVEKNVNMQQFFNKLKKPFIVVKWKVNVDSHLFFSTTLLTYAYRKENGEKDEEQLKLKSTVEGTVQELLVKEGDVVEPGAPVLKFQSSCSHELVIKEICAQCGADLWRSGMFQCLPGIDLRATQEQAEQLLKAGELQLLRERKLALLIFLDQTLTDTVTSQGTSCSLQCTEPLHKHSPKIRPGAQNFLKVISNRYALHFYTNGNGQYADEILKFLDPCSTLVSQRIWTKGLCDSTGSLRGMFPHGDSMVCAVASEYSALACEPNFIHIMPYTCPLPNESDSTENNSVIRGNQNNCISVKMLHENDISDSALPTTCCDSPTTLSADANYSKCHCTNDLVLQDQDDSIDKQKGESQKSSDSVSSETVVNDNSDEKLNDVLTDPGISISTMSRQQLDDNMFCLERMLLNIHNAYYSLYDQMIKQRMYVIHQKVIPELKNVIPYVRQNILKGVNIVFSGLMPTNVDTENSPLYTLAKSIGANVANELVLNNDTNGTTHIIAAKLGTKKTNAAKRYKNIYIVSSSWLLYCARCLEKVDERLFLLKKGSSDTEQITLTENEVLLQAVAEIGKCSETTCDSAADKFEGLKENFSASQKTTLEVNSLNAVLNLSSQDLADMSNEVDEECTTEGSDDESSFVWSNSCSSVDGDCMTEESRDGTFQEDIRHETDELSTSDSFDDGDVGETKSAVKKRKRNHSSTFKGTLRVTRKRRKNNCSFYSIKHRSVPIWKRSYDDVSEKSDSDSDFNNDYIYSEDEDSLVALAMDSSYSHHQSMMVFERL